MSYALDYVLKKNIILLRRVNARPSLQDTCDGEWIVVDGANSFALLEASPQLKWFPVLYAFFPTPPRIALHSRAAENLLFPIVVGVKPWSLSALIFRMLNRTKIPNGAMYLRIPTNPIFNLTSPFISVNLINEINTRRDYLSDGKVIIFATQ